MTLLGLLNIPVLWLGWATLLLSFGLYAVFELLCGGYYKYQNLQQRYKAEWALVTGASSGDNSNHTVGLLAHITKTNRLAGSSPAPLQSDAARLQPWLGQAVPLARHFCVALQVLASP